MERKALSKRLRFEIFKRDGFRCTYCGATPVSRPLHVDHVKPVVEGGTDEPANLVTACGDCNLGKSKVPLEKKKHAIGKLTEADLDHAEQIREYLAVQRNVSEAKESIREHLLDEWSRRLGDPPHGLRPRIIGMVTEFGTERLLEAFDIIEDHGPESSTARLKYLHGILRNWREAASPLPVKRSHGASSERSRVLRARSAVETAVAEISASPGEWPTFEDRIGKIGAMFAEAAGASNEDIREYYGVGEYLYWKSENGVELHGVRLRIDAANDKIRPSVEEVAGYDAFREAYEELAQNVKNSVEFVIAYHDYKIGRGEESSLDELETQARELLKEFSAVRDWVRRYKKEDLGEEVGKDE